MSLLNDSITASELIRLRRAIAGAVYIGGAAFCLSVLAIVLAIWAHF